MAVLPAPNVRLNAGISWSDIRKGDAIAATGAAGADGLYYIRIADINASQAWGTIAEIAGEDTWVVKPDESHTDRSLPRDSRGYVRVVFDTGKTVVDLRGALIPLERLRAAKSRDVVAVNGIRPPAEESLSAWKVNFITP